MRSVRWIWVSLALALLWTAAAPSWAQKKTTRSSKAAPPSAGKKAAPKSAGKKAVSSKSSRRRGTTAKRRTRATTARRTYRASQQTPAKERYADIQKALAEKGYFEGAADGSWSDGSVQALKRFQQDQNLKADGKLSSLSLIALGLGPKRTPYSPGQPPASVTPPEAPPQPVEPEPPPVPQR